MQVAKAQNPQTGLSLAVTHCGTTIDRPAPHGALPPLRGDADRLAMRFFDIFVSASALLLFLPFLLLTALSIRLSSAGPILFVQQRIGYGARPFPCLKFRSMVTDAPEKLAALLASSEDARQEWARDAARQS